MSESQFIYDNGLPAPSHDGYDPRQDKGGLRPPPGLSFWGKAWWWFHFLILVKIARLRFIAILVVIGLIIVQWNWLVAVYERWTRAESQEQAAISDTEYFCPMHPAVVRDQPKQKCPICGMPLSRRKKGDNKLAALPPGIVNRVQLSPYKVVLAGIKTWQVQHVPLIKEISTVGFIEFNEKGLKQVSARVKGRIDQLYVNQTGQMVHDGDDLALLYSPELVVAAQTLLDAKQSNNMSLLQLTQEKLELLGIGADQIQQILKTGKKITHLKIRSPMEGHVTRKYVQEGQYVEEGAPLFDLADLSKVWIQAQVYEDDLVFLPPQSQYHKATPAPKEVLTATATTQAFPNEPFTGKLNFIFPHLDQDTRTVAVRFELENPEHKLRPGTSATVKIRIPPKKLTLLAKALGTDWAGGLLAEGTAQALVRPGQGFGVLSLAHGATNHALWQRGLVLAVPEGAVIDTGSQKIVYRETGPAEYEGVLVELGPRMTGPAGVPYYPVLSGLGQGDLVVTAGSFLLDAETRLNPAAGSIYFGGSGGAKGGPSAVSNVQPSTPKEADLTPMK
jgi:Cu(I)/Ag(I) efflux system membrane fusion protein